MLTYATKQKIMHRQEEKSLTMK